MEREVKAKRAQMALVAFGGGQNIPFLHSDRTISNLDLVTALKMGGVRVHKPRDGQIVLCERRPGNCLYCGGKHCGHTVPILKISCSEPFVVELCTCMGRSFSGKRFFRDCTRIEIRLIELLERGRFVFCPRCHAKKLFPSEDGQPDEQNAGATSRSSLIHVICQNCGFTVIYESSRDQKGRHFVRRGGRIIGEF